MPANLRFADPWVLTLLAGLPLLVYLYRRLRPSRPRRGVVLSTLMPLAQLRPSWRVRLRSLLAVLPFLAVTLVIVGLARPQVVDATATTTSEGIDVVLALDISGSMSEPGLGTPTKLAGAKQALRQFLESRRNDRVGLVVFKSEARVLSPLTVDYRALAQQIDQADTQNQQLQEGTGIGVGLAEALNLLRGSQARSRVVILATDGENNVTTVEPEQAGAIAEALKVRVYTVGIPTAGAKAELTLDERQMSHVAEVTGGTYVRAASAQGLANTFAAITTLEKSRFERDRFTRSVELAPWPLTLAFVFLAASVLLDVTVLRRAP
jgi:Ca-activated chloride channel family protein